MQAEIKGSFWLGADFDKEFEAFIWTSSGVETNFTNWKEKQPDNKGASGNEVSCRKLDRDVMLGIENLPLLAKPGVPNLSPRKHKCSPRIHKLKPKRNICILTFFKSQKF